MDIIDIMIAKAITPQGQADQAALIAQQAAREAKADATDANASMVAALAARNSAGQYATAASTAAGNAASAADTEIDKLVLALTDYEVNNLPNDANSESSGHYYDLTLTYPSGKIETIQNIVKLYYELGDNTDGSVSQNVITNYINSLQDDLNNLTLEVRGGLDQLDTRVTALEEGGGHSGPTYFGTENAGHMVSVGDDGYATVSSLTGDEIMTALIAGGHVEIPGVIGLEIDYVNKTFKRVQEAKKAATGYDFSNYAMYGNRGRCVVAPNGEIVAKYNDLGYMDELSAAGISNDNAVMVYQPKFYYMRVPLDTVDNNLGGKTIRKETILLSDTPQAGFKVHPAFLNDNNEEVDYILIGAFEASNVGDRNDEAINDFSNAKLTSAVGVKPISGYNKSLNMYNAQTAAQNRGTGWDMMSIKVVSAQQMLELVEFGTLNMQSAIERGLVDLPLNSSYNGSSNTGSTVSFHTTTGHADQTVNSTHGSTIVYEIDGKRAIVYRGVENPWGNIWEMVNDARIRGGQIDNGGVLQLYEVIHNAIRSVSKDWVTTGLKIPNTYDWISGFNYNEYYDWLFLPCETNNGNSALPVGDYFWSTADLNGTNMVLTGGAWSYGDSYGPFSYAFDKTAGNAYPSCGTRIIFMPDKNATYYSETINIMEYEVD